MNFYIVIPAHNEARFISEMLSSVVCQTKLPRRLVVVNDNSTDNTQNIVETFTKKHDWISSINTTSTNQHIPGSKVINAFYKGFETLDDNYDVICKFDADIILPPNYLERLSEIFTENQKAGIVGGLAYIKKNNAWVYENIAKKTHVRGPFKAYRKACFKAIGGLKKSIGWDTVDTLLAKYHGWEVVVDKLLHVKHLKPTGNTYNETSKHLQGEALYKMRYGFIITCIAALKMGYKKRSFNTFKNYLLGFHTAKQNKIPFIVTKEEGKFIRNLRWRGMLGK
ncbi:glycosyltransferase family 2 protein [Mangrovimonas spongiae]|uniref:Glycosyltransferase family 2 protein n=1 Tax=Mangrovimonas spongiae TaxID=2494697 RepID=A0A428K6E6_9FLAO|nr:glycosyltransferase family A protein [Mangrovimonas spongiae]RSK42044.1 glycosyltransferase family 2 protein [Mangrovimonas spongiae]